MLSRKLFLRIVNSNKMFAILRGSTDHIMAVSHFMIIARNYKIVCPIFTSNSGLEFMNGGILDLINMIE